MDLLHYSVTQALQTLREGGLILYPTDTVWGIGCDATSAKAVDRIYTLKQRADTKSLIILLADERALVDYVAVPPSALPAYLGATDRPTTVIYENARGLPGNLVAADGTIAIRITKDVFCKLLIERLGSPIVSTSANISGDVTPKKFSEITGAVREGVDYVVDYRQDDETPAMPSRIVRLSREGAITVIRD